MKEVKFSLIAVEMGSFFIHNTLSESDINKLNQNINYRFGFGKPNTVVSKIHMIYHVEEKKIVELETRLAFEIQNIEDWFSTNENGTKHITIPKSFAAHISALNYSSARGMFYLKTKDTSLNKLLVPISNVTDVICEDIVFEIMGENAEQRTNNKSP